MTTEIETELPSQSDLLGTATGDRAPEGCPAGVLDEHLLRVRVGHGANCSSIGSVVDTLFATAVVGAAVFAAVVAALESEEVRVAGRRGEAGTTSHPEDARAAGRQDDVRVTERVEDEP
jgi:hypothetical protein